MILRRPDAIESPFFLLLPHWARIPMVLLAMAATVIASQAVISGAFSVSRQAMQMGFLPRLTVRHTSPDAIGQIYVPAVNWALFLLVVAVVVGFGSSERLGSAYGVAVSGTFVITTLLFLAVARWRWRWPRWLLLACAAVFLSVEATFLAANMSKLHDGGWLSLVIAGALYLTMTTWHRGSEIVRANRVRQEGPLREFVAGLHALDPPLPRVSGTAVFLNPSKETTPLALRANVEHNHVLHERVVIVTVQSETVPRVQPGDRVRIDDLGFDDDNIAHVTARFGFQEEPNVPQALRLANENGLECDIDVDGPTYFLSRATIRVTGAPGMAAGASGCSRSPITPPTRSSTSACRRSARSRWDRRSRCSRGDDRVMTKPILVGYEAGRCDRAPLEFGLAAASFTSAPPDRRDGAQQRAGTRWRGAGGRRGGGARRDRQGARQTPAADDLQAPAAAAEHACFRPGEAGVRGFRRALGGRPKRA